MSVDSTKPATRQWSASQQWESNSELQEPNHNTKPQKWEYVMEKRCNKVLVLPGNPVITTVYQILGLIIRKGDPEIDIKAKGSYQFHVINMMMKGKSL